MHCGHFIRSTPFGNGQKADGDKNQSERNPIRPTRKFAPEKKGKQERRRRSGNERSQSIHQTCKSRRPTVKHENEHGEKRDDTE